MKLAELQRYLRKEKITYLLLTNSDPNFTYFTGLKDLSLSFLAVLQKGKPLLFVTALDKEKTSSATKNILIKKPLEKTLRKYLKPKVMGYNSQVLTLYSYKKFKKIFSKVKFKDTSGFLQQLRVTKTKKEVDYLRKAARLTTLAFAQIVKGLKGKKFKTENDIAFFLQKFALEHDTELSFPPIVASGSNSRFPHHETSNKKLGKGFLLLDFGISYKTYCSDMTRVLYLGKPTRYEREMYALLLKVQKEGIENLAIGKKTGAVDAAVRNGLGKYGSYFIHGLGHGVGVEIHERPSLKPDSEDVVLKDQVLTIEPGIYLKNFGLRIEDTILAREKVEVLTWGATKKLLIISSVNPIEISY